MIHSRGYYFTCDHSNCDAEFEPLDVITSTDKDDAAETARDAGWMIGSTPGRRGDFCPEHCEEPRS